MENLGPEQLKILSTLLFKPGARFKEINEDRLGTDHLSYHIRCLLNGGYVKKDGALYSLTAMGKITAAKIDTKTKTIEKQPKVSVILVPHRRGERNEVYLIQQRTKEPYFGYWGFMAGKVRYGETIPETAARELAEESGLTGNFHFRFEIHEMVYRKGSGEQLEDKFFHLIDVSDLNGSFLESTKEGKNRFVTVEEFREIKPKFHNENDLMNWYLKGTSKFIEEKYYIDQF